MAGSPLLDRIRGLHPDADRYLVKARPWLDRAPLVLLGVGVLWILLVAVLWLVASGMIVAFELDALLHLFVAGLALLLVLAYVAAAVVAWVLVKKLKGELSQLPARDASHA